jgi:hypothetical protein
MHNPLRPALDRIDRGFTLPQKLGLTVLGFIYVVCPLDFDVVPLLGWLDDGAVVYLGFRMWGGPTLPFPNGGGVTGKSSLLELLRHHASEFAQGFKEGQRG